ncbi:MAG: GHKL domain-containing protein, partial [Bdellovibrionales bacterium]|nr:GHKL domain-containing protein [Bdellovibrionales bacterium]
ITTNLSFLKEGFLLSQIWIRQASNLIKAQLENGSRDPLAIELVKQLESGKLYKSLKNTPSVFRECFEGTNSITATVTSMLEFAHPGTTEMEPYDLNQAVRAVSMISKGRWKSVAGLQINLQHDLPLIPAYRSEINQVILNLLTNAIDAVRTKKRVGIELGIITISTTCDDDFAYLRISDSGTGIPENIGASVFHPFFTTKAVGEGTGQGLTIARNIVVRRHSGTISYESEVGIGTTFTVRLPLQNIRSEDEQSPHTFS